MSGRERGKNRWARMTRWIYREFTVRWSSAKCFTRKLSQLVLLIEPGDSGSLQVSLKVTTVSRGRGGTWTSSDDMESKLNYDNSPFSSDNVTHSDIWNEKKIFLTWKHFIWDLIPSRQPFKREPNMLRKITHVFDGDDGGNTKDWRHWQYSNRRHSLMCPGEQSRLQGENDTSHGVRIT